MTAHYTEDLAQALFKEAGDALFLFDPATGQLLDVNPMAQELSGLTREELLPLRTTDLLRAEVDTNMTSLRNAYQQTGNFHARDGFQLRTRRAGVWIPVNITITRLHLQRRTLGLITARDLRQQRHAFEKLKKMESELRHVLTSVSDCLWSAKIDENKKWQYRYLSPVFTRITGRPVEAFMGGPDRWRGIVHPDDRAPWEQGWAKLKNGQPHQQEYRILRPDGAIHWVRENVQVNRSSDGKVLLLDGIVTDITDSKQAEDELRRSEERFRDLFENASDLIQQVTPQGMIVFANRAWRDTLGYGEHEVAGQ